VSAQLGHASPVTTMRWYAAWIPTGDRSLIDRLEAIRLAVTVTDVTDEAPELKSATASERPDTPAELLGEPSGTRTRDPLIKLKFPRRPSEILR
jgi:hypothetical protein